MDDQPRRCARCGRAFREADNGDAACRYHPGHLRDYNDPGPGSGAPGDFWDCCMRQVDSGEPLDVPACAEGRHVEASPDDPGPVLRELEAERKLIERLLKDHGLRPAPPARDAKIE